MDDIDKYILKNWNKRLIDLGTAVGLDERTISRKKAKLVLQGKAPKTEKKEINIIEEAKTHHKNKHNLADFTKKEKRFVEEIERLTRELEASKAVKEISSYEIKPKVLSGKSEAVAVVVASDWHLEETVKPETVSGLNEFNLTIADRRIKQFWQSTLRVIGILNKDIEIKTCVLALLGDFISGSIHDELMEGNSLLPMDAIIKAQEHIVSGIEFLLKNSELNLVIPCHSGNHARVTKKQRHATESGNSLEYFMYHNLALHFKGNKRVQFVVSPGYHSYIDVLGYTIRFHHGHDIKYGGGIGGIFIPAFKAISQWNKGRPAYLDVFGHFHSRKDGGNFVCNGSIIGYSAFALSIKADFEKPSQLLFLIDKKRGKTLTAPIILE